jgi:lysine-N-methylase
MGSRSLTVLMPKIPGQRWSCHSCGDCCRVLVGHLTPEEARRIDEQGWSNELGVAPYVRIGANRVLNKRPDGACVFLDENNLCMIHSRFGEQAKPLACRIFPFSVRPVVGGWQASFRFDCPSAARSEGKPIGEHQAFLTRLVRELDHDASRSDELPDLNRGVRASNKELDHWLSHLRRWLQDEGRALNHRLIGAALMTETLHSAPLTTLRDARFVDLLDRMFAALPSESLLVPQVPTMRQRGMLRQIAFVHAEHVTIAQRRENMLFSFFRRLGQLHRARRFFRGRGALPRLPGFDGHVLFDDVEAVAPAREDRDAVENLLGRYLAARIEGQSVFGGGYYGWPVLAGFAALWLSIAATGWLARIGAAATGRNRLAFGDVATALGVVDRAATRLPALGTFAERARITYLAREDGVSRLIHAYRLTESEID